VKPEVGVRAAPCGELISSSDGECNWWIVEECAKEEEKSIADNSEQIAGGEEVLDGLIELC